MAAQLGVSQPYVHKVLRKAHSDGWDALMREGREVVTFSTLEDARRFTERLRTAEPELLAPIRHDRDSAAEPHAMTVDESIAARWRDIAYERRNALSRERRHATFSVRVR
jgi:Mn-dependent DtxR family transcriptional regulator